MQEIDGVAPKMLPAEVRDYLAKFLFTGDDVFKRVGMLSGGERGRLALACLALQGANLLLLDEPTNHLDLPSQEVLQAILAGFNGTILLVSHDRYLIDALATQILGGDSRPGFAARLRRNIQRIQACSPNGNCRSHRRGSPKAQRRAAPPAARAEQVRAAPPPAAHRCH
jgi:ATPase subunit of ABC transporter with duplicated ATPase domains